MTTSKGHNPDAGSTGLEGQPRIRDGAILLGGLSVIMMIRTSMDFNFDGLQLHDFNFNFAIGFTISLEFP